MVKVNKEFSGFKAELVKDNPRKQKLSNHVVVEVDTERGPVSVRLTLREASALRNFLNANL